MITLKKLSPTVFVLIIWIIFLSVYFSYQYHFSFNYELKIDNFYLLSFVSLFSWFCYFLTLFAFNGQLNINKYFLIFVSNLIIASLIFTHFYSFSNEYVVCCTSVVLVLIAILIESNLNIVIGFIYFLLGLFFFNIFSVFFQIDLSTIFDKLEITGNFRNSGIFSSYLVINIPFLYYVTYWDKNGLTNIPIKLPIAFSRFIKPAKRFLFILTVTLILVIVAKSVSRTSFFILFVLIVSYLKIYFWNEFVKIVADYPYRFILISIFFVIGFVILGAYLFHLKEMSAYGRMMKLDIASGRIYDHFWLGTGLGRFTWYYPHWQAQYFAGENIRSAEYFLSAGESFLLFNEYIQLFMTVGFLGFFAFVIFLVFFFSTKSNKYTKLLNTSKITVISILAWGAFSYPFHVNFILLILVFCFGLALIVDERNIKIMTSYPKPIIKYIFLTSSLVVASLSVFLSFNNWQVVEKLKSLEGDYGFLYIRNKSEYLKIKNVYQSAMADLGSDGKFLTNYGKLLLTYDTDGIESISVLERAKKYFVSRETSQSLSDAYKKSKNYNKAIENQLWICNYLPNLFGPKLDLMKLYMLNQDTLNAKKEGLDIMSMPVKIPSYRVDRIKAETQDLLSSM